MTRLLLPLLLLLLRKKTKKRMVRQGLEDQILAVTRRQQLLRWLLKSYLKAPRQRPLQPWASPRHQLPQRRRRCCFGE
jgi:hypothetical protein